MKKTINLIHSSKYSFLIYLLIIGFLFSCNKSSDNINSNEVVLLSYGPAGVKHGEDIKIIGKNLDKVTSVELGGIAIEKSVFVSQSSDLIIITVPQDATRGKLILVTPNGNIESKSYIDFNVPVKILNIPSTVRPGQTITIHGEYLNWIKSILIPADTSVTQFTSASYDELVLTVPITAQTGKWLFSTGGTEPMEFTTETEINITLPSISTISPNPVMPETNVTINGNDLDLVKEIKLNGVSNSITSFVSKTPTQIILKVPKEAKAGKVTLVAYSDVAIVSPDDVNIVLPSIVSFTPNPIDRGQSLTITGTNFNLVKSVSLKGTNLITNFVDKTDDKIVISIPTDVVSGKIGLITYSGVTVESNNTLLINGDLPPLAPLKYIIYDDNLQNSWQQWSGWGGSVTDLSSTEKIRQGERAMKVTFAGGWSGGAQLGGTSASTNGNTELAFALYGGTGTNGQKLKVIAKGGDNESTEITIIEGEWTEYKIPLSVFGNPAAITEFTLQDEGWTGVVYIDYLGMR